MRSSGSMMNHVGGMRKRAVAHTHTHTNNERHGGEGLESWPWSAGRRGQRH